MTVKQLSLLVFFLAGWSALTAQEAATPAMAPYRSFTPKDQWEIGIHAGVPYLLGDIDAKPGFGGGLHVRKAIDHIFSLRASATFAKTKGESPGTANDPDRSYDLQFLGGSAQVVATLNNFRFDRAHRRINLNGFAGLGYSSFTTDYKGIPQLENPSQTDGTRKANSPYVEVGGGLAFRVSPKFNIGLEYSVISLFGKNSDLLDGEQNLGRAVTTFRDNLHYPHLLLNFNIGGKAGKDGVAKSEPLYWSNPLGQVSEAITALEARPIYDPTDTDKDGIIDAIDDEDESPAGARVDSRGVTLDSDMDKVPDYKDKEPYSPPGFRVDPMGVAQVPKPISEDDVNRIVDAKLAAYKPPVQPGLSDWFLPMVNFEDNRYDIRYSEYEKLYQVASVLKQNPNLKVVATGSTDARASEQYNNVLSYNRANAAVNFIVTNYGIARDRLILNWNGEGSPLIPVKGAILQNRRVEFRVAKGETEMNRPEGPEAGKKPRMSGNKAAGY